MGKPREFTTLPARAIADQRLSGLELRCLAVISMHDGMSLARGTGAGCFASAATLASLVRTDVTNWSKAVSRLVALGYIVREPQQMDRRRFTLRVLFGDDDSWRNDQLFPPADRPGKVGGSTNQRAAKVGQATNEPAEIVGDGEGENGGISSGNGSQYISLNEELHSDKTEEINSVETAQHASRAARREEYSPGPDDDKHFLESAYRANTPGKEKDRAKAPLGRENMIEPLLPRSFWTLPQGAQLVHLDAALNELGSRVDDLMDAERDAWAELLVGIWDAHSGVSLGRHAERLHAKMTYREEAA